MRNEKANMRIGAIKLYFLLLMVFCSCNSSTSTEVPLHSDFETIEIGTPGQDSIVHLSNFIKSVKLVPLEFSDSSIIGDVKKMKLYNERIYIHDKYQTSLLIFDIQGNFLHSIGVLGKGENAYLDLTSFDVNEKGVFIYNYNLSEIYHYDHEGKPLQKTKVGDFQGEYFATKSGFYYLYRRSPKTGSKFELNIYDSEFNDHVGYFPSNIDFESVGVNGLFSGTTSDGSLPFHLPLNDTIYMLNKNKIAASYFIDFGKHRISEEDRLALYKNMAPVDDVSAKKDFAFGVNNVQSTDNYLFFNYHYRYILHPVFYNKKNKTVINSYNIFDDISYMIFANPITQYENKLVGIFYPDGIKNNITFIQRLIKEKEQVTDQGLENLQLLESLSKDVFSANAMVILYTL